MTKNPQSLIYVMPSLKNPKTSDNTLPFYLPFQTQHIWCLLQTFPVYSTEVVHIITQSCIHSFPTIFSTNISLSFALFHIPTYIWIICILPYISFTNIPNICLIKGKEVPLHYYSIFELYILHINPSYQVTLTSPFTFQSFHKTYLHC